jgi:enoyl-CoA hydratase/carnithine racemase
MTGPKESLTTTVSPVVAEPHSGPLMNQAEQSDRDAILAQVDGPLATLTISRPHKRNALTTAMWIRIGELAAELADTAGVRVIALCGDGGCFSAGADLRDVLTATSDLDAATQYCRTVVGALAGVAHCRVPTVAVVDGVASGGGVELALAADNRIATPRSTFQLPFSSLGVVPDALTLRRLTATVGEATAQWMMLTGRPVDAPAALRTGLIDELVTDRPVEAAAQIAQSVARSSFPALLRARELVKPRLDAGQVDRDAEQMARSFVSGSVREAALRFTTTRSPSASAERADR